MCHVKKNHEIQNINVNPILSIIHISGIIPINENLPQLVYVAKAFHVFREYTERCICDMSTETKVLYPNEVRKFLYVNRMHISKGAKKS